ncbi:MAG: hypothetical protein PHT75_03720 [Bacilli bacterium]|nr:hypothetical protein [Bacilli bacterium]MDD3305199.1 hypothetical protein [Bacilli bacterium]MDD4054000.1 hypothetical protein [Bacilli bacterium]MDD4411754.1 hypothetical protein [Bacilli bacterium]
MFLEFDLRLFFNDLYTTYEILPNEAKLIIYIIVILLFIASILTIILLEQKRINSKIVKEYDKVSENTEVLDFDIEDIDETNEKTRNLKEITDKIQAVIDNRAVDLTKFEQDQEENSIISYGELMKSVGKPVEKEPEKDFSLPNLVRKIEVDEELDQEEPYVEPVEEKKFKSSVFISPVFGIQGQNQNQTKTVVESELIKKPTEIYKQDEFKEEETFLNNLINFRKNLD